MKLPSYANYRPCAIEWIEKLPEHWQVLPFTKYVAERSDYRGKTPEKTEAGVFLVTAKNVRMGLIDYETSQEYVAEEDYDEIMRRGLPKKGDILFTTEAPLGNIAIVDREDVALAQRIIRFRMKPDCFLSKFTLYAMISDQFQVQLQSLSTGSTAEGLKASKLPLLRLVAPPVDEQSAIADFLDHETAKIDSLIVKKTTLIARLKERRAALISHTVTHGLPPDDARAAGLDPHPKLKPSGIDWLGEMPEHWHAKRLRYISPHITVGIVVEPSKYYEDDGIPCLRSLNVRPNELLERDLVHISAQSHAFLSKSMIRKGDLVAVRSGQPGTTAVVDDRFDRANCIDLIIIRKPARGVSEFFSYFLNSVCAQSQFAEGAGGAIQQHFNIATASDLWLVEPPGDEQRAIADFLDRETKKIDNMIAKIETAIERLHEYRTALITAAVTGKIDVRSFNK